MEEEYEDYATFTVMTSQGEEVELAILDEFDFEKKTYVAAARVVGDEIDEEGVFLYRYKDTKDGFITEKITDRQEYARVAQAYAELQEL